jgi:phospholipase A1/A2
MFVTSCRALIALALAGAALAGLALPVGAAEHSKCAGIAKDSDRLACYDQASGVQATPPAPPQAVPGRSMLEEVWASTPSAPRYVLRYHEMNYFLPITYTSDRNVEPWKAFSELPIQDGEVNLDDAEAKFQVSFKYRLWATDDRKWGFWMAYTQQSTWQIYNGDESRPFRDTNYRPELFLSYNPGVDIGSFRWSLLNTGYVHESNGRSEIISRSWNRLFAEAGFENGNFALLAKAWYRIPEDDDDDDNPDITDYYGHGQLRAFYRWNDHTITLMTRGNWNTGKGAVEASFLSRPLIGPLRVYLQLFHGYGESMIDYDWNQTVVGAGVAINSIL